MVDFAKYMAGGSTRKWTPQQLAIFADAEEGRGDTRVEALAGTAKTTSAIESLNYVPPSKRILMTAFSKQNQEELRARAPQHVDAKTFHSIGLNAVKRAFGDCEVRDDKRVRLAKWVLSGGGLGDLPSNRDMVKMDDLPVRGAHDLANLVKRAKNELAETYEQLEDLAVEHELDQTLSAPVLADAALKVLELAGEIRTIVDYEDMIWMPYKHQLRPQSHDVVFVDERQDLNRAQVAMVESLLRRNGRVVAIGDRRQAIFGFRGASAAEIDALLDRRGAKTLPLSVTFRCPKKVVELARIYVPDYQAHEDNAEGRIEALRESELPGRVWPGDVILSRSNAPLMTMCLRLIAQGIPAMVRGRDIGERLLSLVKEARREGITVVPDFLRWLNQWRQGQVERFQALKREDKLGEVQDRFDALVALAEGTRNTGEIQEQVDRLFADTNPKSRVVLSTVHKAKGLEWDNVFLLEKTFKPAKSQEEENIYYVAITRAIQTLTFVRPD